MFKRFIVIALSLVIFAFSAIVMYGAWLVFDDVGTLWRAILSLFSWIFAFAAGSVVFWKAVTVLSRRSV